MPSWPIFASQCRSVASCGCSFETGYASPHSLAVVTPVNPAAESRVKARVRATATQVDTNATLS